MRTCADPRILFVATCIIASHDLFAQTPAGARPGVTGIGEVRGTITDSVTGRAVMNGSITVRRAGDSSFAGGSLPNADGTFRVDGLVAGRYTVRIRALGFGQVIRGDIVISAGRSTVDLGIIKLNTVVATLVAQDVVAEREDIVIAPDRNIYSTKNMSAAAGGTAIDVLRNIPQVEVDGLQKVSLRGNENVVVQINGRTTPLRGEQLGRFLAQLPAGTLKAVEVATSPSAKNDPEGTAGIINLVLNQDAELGLSGGLFAATASTGQYLDLGANVGTLRGAFTLFVSGTLYRDHRLTSGTIARENLAFPVPAYVDTRMGGTNQPLSGGGTVRSEYRFNDRDVLSFDSFLFGGSNTINTTSDYTDFDGVRRVIGLFNQFNKSALGNSSQDYAFAVRHKGAPTTAEVSTEIEYTNNYNRSDVDLSGDVVEADITTPASIPREVDNTNGHLRTWKLKADYTKPFSAHTKLEAGFQGRQRSTRSDFIASFIDAAGGYFVPSVARSTGFDYEEDTKAIYAVFSQQVAKAQAQAGLRLEDASTHLDVPGSSHSYDNHYKSAFPSAILSYRLTDTRQAKLSYSRRVSRPDPQQLSPAEYRQDTRNVFRGNPALRSEYTDAMELSFMDARSWGSIQINPYLLHTAHAVRNIQFVDSTGVSVSTFDNVASTLTTGADFNASLRHGPLSGSGGGSVYYYSSDASNLSGDLSVHAIVWSLRGNAMWKVSPLLDAQVFANYRAPYAREGGSQIAQLFMNASARYKAWGDQGSITLRISDPFRLQKFGYRTANSTVIESNERYFGARAVYLNISRTFGKAVKLREKEPEADQRPPAAP
ncbi:MAG: TonB-dependent receptor [Gemmatimonadota bacterium]|nr:TonB-dependent receptor [Gemmatimonadota bacterium]